MDIQRVFLNYKSVQNFLEFLDTKDLSEEYLLYDHLDKYFNSKFSLIDITIDRSKTNVLIINSEAKKLTLEINNILKLLKTKNLVDENVCLYIIESPQNLSFIGKLPHLLTLINPDFEFDIIFCQSIMLGHHDIYNLRTYAHSKTFLIMDRPLQQNYSSNKLNRDWQEIDLLEYYNCFIPLLPEPTSLEISNSLFEFDLPIDIFIERSTTVIKTRTTLEDLLFSIVKHVLHSSIINLKLNKRLFNILVMCSTNETVENENYKKIIKETIQNVEVKDAAVYHIGKDIGIEYQPSIQRCYIENLNIEKEKFNVIICENTSSITLRNNINKISSILEKGGIIICNLNTHVFNGYSTIPTSSSKYIILFKLE